MLKYAQSLNKTIFLRKMVLILCFLSEISSEISEIPKCVDFNTKVLKSSDFTRIEDSREIYLSRDFKEISRTFGLQEDSSYLAILISDVVNQIE